MQNIKLTILKRHSFQVIQRKTSLLTATKCFNANAISTTLVVPWLQEGKKVAYYNDTVKNVISRIRGWYSKVFSPDGRAIFIRHILLALPTHFLSVVNPPKLTLELIENV